MRIYLKLYDDIMNIMMRKGIVKTVLISSDLYGQLTEDERYNIQSLMECSSRIRWMINTEKENFYDFMYLQYPEQKVDNGV